ncbi:MAG: putative DNA replication licensing factor MCM5, partial [Streblomastix strix]
VCIDEFDKMNAEDRVAIHEAMEQQTISIAKAGITTMLNSRCAVLAAANPLFGTFSDISTQQQRSQYQGRDRNQGNEEQVSLAENIDFQTTILSRFDLIFLIRDVVDAEQDKKIAQRVYELHGTGPITSSSNQNERRRNEVEEREQEKTIHMDLLKKYIAHCRRSYHPVLTEEAISLLLNEYVDMRERYREGSDGPGVRANKRIPITVRQLEACVRISEAFARMSMRHQVTPADVREAMSLFRQATGEGAGINRQQAFVPTQIAELLQNAILSKIKLNTTVAKSTIERDIINEIQASAGDGEGGPKSREESLRYLNLVLASLVGKGVLHEVDRGLKYQRQNV